MDQITVVRPPDCLSIHRDFCTERRSLLSKYLEAISAVNRELAEEINLPPSKRLHTLAAARRKERVKGELRFHGRSHGCGVPPVGLNKNVGVMPTLPNCRS
jgi:hypothetical protein